jgi:hypothetical protein
MRLAERAGPSFYGSLYRRAPPVYSCGSARRDRGTGFLHVNDFGFVERAAVNDTLAQPTVDGPHVNADLGGDVGDSLIVLKQSAHARGSVPEAARDTIVERASRPLKLSLSSKRKSPRRGIAGISELRFRCLPPKGESAQTDQGTFGSRPLINLCASRHRD